MPNHLRMIILTLDHQSKSTHPTRPTYSVIEKTQKKTNQKKEDEKLKDVKKCGPTKNIKQDCTELLKKCASDHLQEREGQTRLWFASQS